MKCSFVEKNLFLSYECLSVGCQVLSSTRDVLAHLLASILRLWLFAVGSHDLPLLAQDCVSYLVIFLCSADMSRFFFGL
jgi:hypothetical protein